MFFRVIGLFFLTSLCFITGVASSDEAPSWLQQAAAIKVPVYDKDVPAVVLQNDQVVNVSEGRDFAGAVEPYLTNSGKVRELHAWLIRPNGVGKKYDKDNIVDRISDPNDIYDEYRVKLIDGSRDADAGAVFGYQSISEERPLFSQDTWAFQNRLPTLLSRYSLALPSGSQLTEAAQQRIFDAIDGFL